MQLTIFHYLVIGVLSYYLIKGLIYLGMWGALGQMEKSGKKRQAKLKEEHRQKLEARNRRARENWNRES